LPSTSLAQTYLITSSGCPSEWENITFYHDYKCAKSRGYFYNATKDVQPVIGSGNYQTDITQFVGFHDYGFVDIQAAFGLDNIVVGDTVAKQIPVGLLADASFTWLGLLGLDPGVSTFSLPSETGNSSIQVQRRSSLLQILKDAGDIPSLSWSYHAGSAARTISVHTSNLANAKQANISMEVSRSEVMTPKDSIQPCWSLTSMLILKSCFQQE
jgi:hypothetical protein